MSALFIALATILVAAEPEEDIMSIDKAEPTRAELKARKLEAHIIRRLRAAEEVEIAAGDTVFVPFEAPIRRRARGTITAVITDVKSNRGIVLPRWLAKLEIDTSGRPAVLQGELVIRAQPTAPKGSAEIEIEIEIRDSRRKRHLATHTERIVITVGAPKTSVELVDLNRRAYLHFQKAAFGLLDALRPIAKQLDLSRLSAPPKAVPQELVEKLATFSDNRLRADIARRRLRAAADVEDPKVAEAAVLAIGALSKRPAKPHNLRGTTVQQSLQAAARALEDLEIDDAEAILNALRKKGRVKPGQLGKLLRSFGAVYAARGRADEAKTSFGRALCVSPGLGPPSKRQPIARLYQSVATNPPCARAVHIEEIVAERRGTEEGLVAVVRVYFGPDPFEVISGGDIEMWGPGGTLIEVKSVRSERGPRPYIEAEFADEGDLESLTGNVLVRALIKSLGGVSVDRRGFPDPVPVPLTEKKDIATQGLPWWVWVVGGVVVAGGAATAAALLIPGDEVRGIGPVTASF